jgi:hypothetical protein
MLTRVAEPESALVGDRLAPARPGGGRIAGWIATAFCAGLAFLNAGLATDAWLLILFLVCGTVLSVGVIVMIVRWRREAVRESQHGGDVPPERPGTPEPPA